MKFKTIGDAMRLTAGHFDADKPPVDQLPYGPLFDISYVFAYGAKKYGRDNWRGGLEWTRYAASALRHLYLWLSGQDNDDESGLPHLAHAACNIMFLLEYQRAGSGKDDRFKSAREATN